MSTSGIAMDCVVTLPRSFYNIKLVQTRHFRWFGFAANPYVVRSTIGLLSDSYASCSVIVVRIDRLKPVHTVAEKYDSRRISPLSRRFRRQSRFSATVWTLDRALSTRLEPCPVSTLSQKSKTVAEKCDCRCQALHIFHTVSSGVAYDLRAPGYI